MLGAGRTGVSARFIVAGARDTRTLVKAAAAWLGGRAVIVNRNAASDWTAAEGFLSTTASAPGAHGTYRTARIRERSDTVQGFGRDSVTGAKTGLTDGTELVATGHLGAIRSALPAAPG